MIVRYSMQSGEQTVRIRNRIRQTLREAGFERIGTASFEARDIDLADAVLAATAVLRAAGSGRLDNLSIYLDDPAGRAAVRPVDGAVAIPAQAGAG